MTKTHLVLIQPINFNRFSSTNIRVWWHLVEKSLPATEVVLF